MTLSGVNFVRFALNSTVFEIFAISVYTLAISGYVIIRKCTRWLYKLTRHVLEYILAIDIIVPLKRVQKRKKENGKRETKKSRIRVLLVFNLKKLVNFKFVTFHIFHIEY